MPEDSTNTEPAPSTHPSYTDADLPIQDGTDENVVPSKPVRQTPFVPTYNDEDLPVWEDDKGK